jgi:hypothetical protein
VAQGAQAVFGMQFALQALGGTFATYALPVAIIVGLITVVKQLFFDTAAAAEELAKKTKESSDKFKEWSDLVTETRGLKEKAGEGNYDVENQKLVRLKNALQDATALWQDYQRTGEQATTEGLKAEKGYLIALQDVKDQTFAIAKMKEDDAKKSEEASKKAGVEYQKQLSDLQKEQDARYALNKLSDGAYYSILLQRREQARLVGDLQSEVLLRDRIAALTAKMKGGTPQELDMEYRLSRNLGGIPTRNMNPGAIKADQFGEVKSTEKLNAESKAKLEASATGQYLIDPLKAGFQSVAWSALQGFNQMWEQSSGFARTVIGQAMEQVADTVLQKLSEQAVTGLLGVIFPGLAGGGDVLTSGSSLQFAANGGAFRSGANVMVGERGPELMQVGRNGVRIISNNNLRNLNQASQASRYGGGNSAQMANAINNLANKLIPQTANDMFFAVKRAEQIRNNGGTA